jgi:hypothetical protein
MSKRNGGRPSLRNCVDPDLNWFQIRSNCNGLQSARYLSRSVKFKNRNKRRIGEVRNGNGFLRREDVYRVR